MNEEIAWRVILSVKPGQLDAFRMLTAEMVEVAQSERGVLSYERFVTEDGKFVHIYERYADRGAALAHLRMFKRRFAVRFSSMVEREQFIVFGHASGPLKQLLDSFGAIYLKLFGNFRYWV